MRRFADTMAWTEDSGGFAIHAAVDERMGFIRRTYSYLSVMLLCVAAVTAIVVNMGATRLGLPVGLISLVGLMFVGGRMMRPGASRQAQFFVAALCVVGFGFLTAGLAAIAAQVTGSYAVMTQALVLTSCIFGGLTGYVFLTKKDFSFLGGMLHAGLWIAIGFSLVGMFFGFSGGMSLLISFGVVLLFCGFILYDTSNVMRRYPVDAHMMAAIVLLIDFVVLFQRIVIILISLTGRD